MFSSVSSSIHRRLHLPSWGRPLSKVQGWRKWRDRKEDRRARGPCQEPLPVLRCQDPEVHSPVPASICRRLPLSSWGRPVSQIHGGGQRRWMQEDIQHQEEPLRLLAKRQNSSLSIGIEKECDMETGVLRFIFLLPVTLSKWLCNTFLSSLRSLSFVWKYFSSFAKFYIQTYHYMEPDYRV